jgi:uncharacterized repeat protein (TIGR03803 family)
VAPQTPEWFLKWFLEQITGKRFTDFQVVQEDKFMPNRYLTTLGVVLLLISLARAATKEEVLYSFNGAGDGGSPNGGVTLDKLGNIYGVSNGCYWSSFGNVFKLARGKFSWTYEPLYEFADEGDGGCPIDGVTAYNNTLVGTTDDGGNGQGSGVIYRVVPGKQNWTYDVVYQFSGGDDGAGPLGVVSDRKGNLYGTAFLGGVNNDGTVFELTPQGDGGWNFTLIYAFNNTEGGTPTGSVIMDGSGNLYGAALWGPNGDGVVYELSPQQNRTWNYTVLHAFSGSDGSGPANLIMDPAGNLYGTAAGGTNNDGLVFELLKSNGWQEAILHTFSGTDGASPEGITLDPSGNLWGAASSGGNNNNGLIFELTNQNGTWSETIVYSFSGPDGSGPEAVTLNPSGVLFGTTRFGGANDVGTVFAIEP